MPISLLLLIILATLVTAGSSQAVYYLSEFHGNDSQTNCTRCSPCKSLSRVNEIAVDNTVNMMLMPGEYPMWTSTSSQQLFEHVSIQGIEYPSCLNLTTEAYQKVVIVGDLKYHNLSSLKSLQVGSVHWRSSMQQGISINGSSLSSLTFRNVVFFDSLSMTETILETNGSLVSYSPDWPLSLNISDSVFLQSLHLARPIEKAEIVNTTFSGGDVELLNLKHASAIVTVSNSTFLNGSALFLQKSNATIRWSQFFRDETLLIPERSAIQVSLPDSLADARGNFWGSPSGPYSCCNPESTGRFVVQADTSSWCLDNLCSKLSKPILAGQTYPNGYISEACEYDSYCPVNGNYYLAAAGATLGVLCFACLLFAALTYSRYRAAMRLEHSAESFSQSGFKTIELHDPDVHRNRVIHFINAAAVVAAIVFAVVSLFPTSTFLSTRQTSLVSTMRNWHWLFAIDVCVNRGFRIICCIWTSTIVAKGQPTYKSLLANVIISSLTLQFAVAFRFSDVVADPMNIITFFDRPVPSFFNLSLGLLINFTKFAWVATLLVILSDFLLALPLLILSLRIIKKRDFAEVDALRRQLQNGPVAGEIKSTPSQRSARIISWISLVSSVILGISAAIAFIALLLVVVILDSIAATLNKGALVLFVLQRATFLFACVLVSFVGFILFRWRFFESAWVTTYVAFALGLSVNIIQVSVYYSFAGINLQSSVLTLLSAGGGTAFLLLILLPALLAFRLLMRMKTKLAPEITSSIYEQLEDQLS